MNSPAIPDRCPKCGADFLRDSNGAIQFHCGSVSKRGYIGVRIETAICTGRQRDQLAERVKELEARLADRDEAAACAVIQDERRER